MTVKRDRMALIIMSVRCCMHIAQQSRVVANSKFICETQQTCTNLTIQIRFTFLVPAYPGSPEKGGPLDVFVCLYTVSNIVTTSYVILLYLKVSYLALISLFVIIIGVNLSK